MEENLSDDATYWNWKIDKDSTIIINEALSKQLQKIKEEKQIDNSIFHILQPTKTRIPRMYGLGCMENTRKAILSEIYLTAWERSKINRYISKSLQKYTTKTKY